MTAKEWLSDYDLENSSFDIEMSHEDYAYYKTKELEDKIQSFRDKLTKCMNENYCMEDNNTNIFAEAMSWRAEFDEHFNLKNES